MPTKTEDTMTTKRKDAMPTQKKDAMTAKTEDTMTTRTDGAMGASAFAACPRQGRTCLPAGIVGNADAPFIPHPTFAGVRLKHLARGADTGGALSCHIVEVDPGQALLRHVHEGQCELHQVLSGHGQARVGETALDYAPGVLAVIPKAAPHEVRAGRDGLTLVAVFAPALL